MAEADFIPELDPAKVKTATDALNDLAAAAVRAQEALADLGMAIVLTGEADDDEPEIGGLN